MAISKINSKSIADGTVVGADITPGTVTNAKISPSAAIANAKLANSSISINGVSASLGGTATINAATDWQAVTVADGSTTVNTVAGKGYFLDTNAGVIEAFLPTSPTRGDRVVLADYSGTFATNQCIVNTGGALLDSTAGNDFKLTANNTIAEFIYVDASKGWLVYLNQAAGTTPSGVMNEGGGYDTSIPTLIAATGGTITTSGDYKIHTFTGDGCFVVSAGLGDIAVADYLVIAGGGGGQQYRSGGGGAGGYRESHSVPVSGCYTASPLATPTGLPMSVGTYPITVGGGGVGGVQGGASNTAGSNSVFSTITSAGGGKGDGGGGAGGAGGSGGGGSAPNGSGGSGNTPPTSPPQGSNGGSAVDPGVAPPHWGAGGGGGASAVGSNGGPGGGGNGGAGTTSSINGTPTARAGGGAGGGIFSAPATTGGSGGGGNSPTNSPGTAGSANTGGGGGGANSTNDSTQNNGGAGGKGIVIIRYKFQ